MPSTMSMYRAYIKAPVGNGQVIIVKWGTRALFLLFHEPVQDLTNAIFPKFLKQHSSNLGPKAHP